MTRARLIGGIALWALSASMTPCFAQSGGSASGGSASSSANGRATTPPGQPMSAHDYYSQYPQENQRSSVSASAYLNGGDYATASAISLAAFSNIAGNSSNTQEVSNLLRLLNRAGGGTAEDEGQLLGDTYRQNAGAPNYNPGPPNSRQVSNYEQQQTALLRERSQTLSGLLGAAEMLVELSENAPREARQEAIATRNNLRENLNNLDTVLRLSDSFEGRSFPDDSTAAQYIRLRTAETNIIQNLGDASRPDSAARIQAQLNALAPSGVRDGRYVLDPALQNNSRASTAEAIQRTLDLTDTRSAGQRRLADQFQIEALSRQPAGNAPAIGNVAEAALLARQASTRFHDPSLQRASTAQSGGTRTGSIDEIPGSANNRGTANSAAAGAQAGAANGQNDSAATSPANTRTASAAGAEVEDNTPPRPVPTTPDYPTVSAEERARISREAAERRAAQQRADAAVSEAQRFAREAAAREAAERAAMVERARISDENHRLLLAAQRLAAQDSRFAAMVRERFGNGAWDAFADGQTVTALQLFDIYRDYNPLNAIPPAMSLSSAGNSLSSAGWSLSSAGLDYRDPAVESLNEVLYHLTNRRGPSGTDTNLADLANQSYMAGSFQVQRDPTGRLGRESGGYVAASLFSYEDPYLLELTANGLSGLDALLAQPFNVILSWGQNAYDLDLHMTGPLGEATDARFHIYYSAQGALDQQPFAALIQDCICNAGSEVILTSALNRGGVYRVSVFNFGDQSASSTNLANMSNAQIQIVRGGVVTPLGNGTTLTGGRVILTTTVPNGQTGNTWVAAEIDPKSGRITVPRRVKQSGSSASVD